MITDEDALRYIDIFISDCHEHATSQDEYDIPDCAGSLCRIDIEKFGYDEWKTWTTEDIVKIFVEVTDSTMSDLLDELASSYAGEELIEELLGSDLQGRLRASSTWSESRCGQANEKSWHVSEN